jgi:ADP-heptose:LPS heptosyltransferase
MDLFLSQKELDEAEALLRNLGFRRNRLRIAVAPGSSQGQKLKRWPAAYFAEICDRLETHRKARVVLLGGPEDTDTISEIMKLVQSSHPIQVSKTTVRQASAIIAHCHLMISNDNGGMHLSAALGVPTVAVFGPSDLRAARPLGVPAAVIQTKDLGCCPCWAPENGPIICKNATQALCLLTISVEEVFDAADRLLREHT